MKTVIGERLRTGAKRGEGSSVRRGSFRPVSWVSAVGRCRMFAAADRHVCWTFASDRPFVLRRGAAATIGGV
jgi:hypothetical protein